jgi:hypothetical protein
MAPFIRKKKRNELARVRKALDKGEDEEVHFTQMSCCIIKTNKSGK